MFDQTELHTVGMLTVALQHPRTKVSLKPDFYMTDREDPVGLLGIDACRNPDMFRIVDENIYEVSEHS